MSTIYRLEQRHDTNIGASGGSSVGNSQDNFMMPARKRYKKDESADPINPNPSKVIHLRRLNPRATEPCLIHTFSRFGHVSYVALMPNKHMGLVEFEDIASAQSCISYSGENSIEILGQPALINYSTSEAIQRTGLESENPNSVILIHVNNAAYPISAKTIHKVCSPHGNVLRISIMRKSILIQALVEFDSAQSARRTKYAINGADIYSGCCTLKVEYAKPTHVNVRNNDTDHWDFIVDPRGPQSEAASASVGSTSSSTGYAGGAGQTGGWRLSATTPRILMNSAQQQSTYSSTQSNAAVLGAQMYGGGATTNTAGSGDYGIVGGGNDGGAGTGLISMSGGTAGVGASYQQQPQLAAVNDGGNANNYYSHYQQQQGGVAAGGGSGSSIGTAGLSSGYGSQSSASDFYLQQQLQQQNQFGGAAASSYYGSQQQPYQQQQYQQQNFSSSMLFSNHSVAAQTAGAMALSSAPAPSGKQATRVVMVYGINQTDFNCDRIFNMLCCYGNCLKIKFMQSHENTCMAEMSSEREVAQVMRSLNGLKVFGSELTLKPSKQMALRDINEPFQLPSGQPSFKDYTHCRNHRFTTPELVAKNRIVGPGPKLYWFNAPPTLDGDLLKQVFAERDAPLPKTVSVFPTNANRRSASGTALFDSVQQAAEALVRANHTAINPNPQQSSLLWTNPASGGSAPAAGTGVGGGDVKPNDSDPGGSGCGGDVAGNAGGSSSLTLIPTAGSSTTGGGSSRTPYILKLAFAGDTSSSAASST